MVEGLSVEKEKTPLRVAPGELHFLSHLALCRSDSTGTHYLPVQPGALPSGIVRGKTGSTLVNALNDWLRGNEGDVILELTETSSPDGRKIQQVVSIG